MDNQTKENDYKCPACGANKPEFRGPCPECGYEDKKADEVKKNNPPTLKISSIEK